ncbi:hypothetical protein C7Y66_10845 [Chroococcidiopsis sp. CCALA 051]|uniref:hypothetical protein n=1 Tax=Chroococcidiopsis sp. CCALA 051 TaxID=869949 RepID=UPI000D0DC14A|nr:hypothetical protein [Chroococcidiopsis sp. CCALA 051]MBE9020584.1 hypothetical protein [Chroococcidiopsidales cyanobacterium LEGE 13417]PSM49115.1 hypothetical protein C7Y66_10845 [Chroococcidiopsis sp. CCALA 051]
MSTKSTIVHGDTFHFYHEVLDEHYVYLSLQGVRYEASYNRVMVPIPIHIWEVIRHRGAPDLSLVNKSDEELLIKVEQDVDKRIKAYEQDPSGLAAFVGSLVYGMADSPRAAQIQTGMEYYKARRKEQQEIKAEIEALEEKNRR